MCSIGIRNYEFKEFKNSGHTDWAFKLWNALNTLKVQNLNFKRDPVMWSLDVAYYGPTLYHLHWPKWESEKWVRECDKALESKRVVERESCKAPEWWKHRMVEYELHTIKTLIGAYRLCSTERLALCKKLFGLFSLANVHKEIIMLHRSCPDLNPTTGLQLLDLLEASKLQV